MGSSDSRVVDAARRWTLAYLAAADASGPTLVAAAVDYDAATHDLIVACGVPCPYCDAGTCPADMPAADARPTADTLPL